MEVERESGFTRVWLNRPEVRNAINEATVRELRHLLAEVAADATCNLLVLQGRNRTYSSGWDVRDFGGLGALEQHDIEARLERNRQVMDQLRTLPQVTLCAIEGAAIGFGLGLASACDLAWAAEDTVFGMPEIRYGIVPGSLLAEIQRTVTHRAGLDWLLSGRQFTAEEALKAGLITRVISRDGFDAEIEAAAARIGAGNRDSLVATKRVYQQAAELDYAAACRLAIQEAAVSVRHPGVGRAAAEFLER